MVWDWSAMAHGAAAAARRRRHRIDAANAVVASAVAFLVWGARRTHAAWSSCPVGPSESVVSWSTTLSAPGGDPRDLVET